MHHQLGGGTRDRLGRVHVGITHHRAAGVARQQMDSLRLAPVPQVQHHVLGQRQRTVGVAGRLADGEHLVDLIGRKVVQMLDGHG
ncbi:hypothetical protein GCM10027610_127640 [Dactylosporangium cerinum]